MDVEDAMNARGLAEQDCLDPVSYTHLDVYKRQAHITRDVTQFTSL